MIENAQSGDAERFNHVHMYHEHPSCAMEWYVDAPRREDAAGSRRRRPRRQRAGRAGSGDVGGLQQSKNRLLTADVAVVREGRVRARSRGRRAPSTTSRSRCGRGRAAASRRTRGRLYDHWAVSTADLDKTVARLKSEGVKFLEEIHPWGTMRAAMIEGPDRIAIELVEVK